MSNLQALIGSVVAQVVAVAVALGLFSSTEGQLFVSLAGTVIALAIYVFQSLEQKKAIAKATVSNDASHL